MKSTSFSLSLSLSLCSNVCMYVLARNILSQSSCSLCSYVCIGLSGPAHPHKVKYSLRSDQIHCFFLGLHMSRENISLWVDVLVFEDQYIHTSRENTSFETKYSGQYIHTSRENDIHMHMYPGSLTSQEC